MEPSVVCVGFKQAILKYVLESKAWTSDWCSHFGSPLFLSRILGTESCLKPLQEVVSDAFLLFAGMVVRLPWR